MDDIRVWTRAITAGEVSELYDSGSGRGYEGTSYGLGNELLILRGPTGTENLGTLGDAADATYNGGMGVVADTDSGGISGFDFDAIDDYMTVVGLGSMVFPFSFSFWSRPDSYADIGVALSYCENITNSTRYMGQVKRSGAWSLTARNVTTYYTAGETVVDDTWAHIVCVFTSNTSKSIYVDGTLSETLATSVVMSSFIDTLHLGKLRLNAANFYSGLLDDVRAWDVALSADELTEIYKNGPGRGYNRRSGMPPSILHMPMITG